MAERDKLRVTWSKREHDLMFHFPIGPQTKCDAHFLYVHLSTRPFVPREDRKPGDSFERPSFIDELKARGYDVKTLRLSIAKDLSHPRWARSPSGDGDVAVKAVKEDAEELPAEAPAAPPVTR
jgi:hypothetical protein